METFFKLGHIPERRKTANFNQWTGYISNKLQQIRGLDPHKKPKR